MRVAYLTTTLDETNGWGRYSAGFLAEARRRNGSEHVTAPDPAHLLSKDVRSMAWKTLFLAFIDACRLRKELRGCDVIHAAIEPAAPLALFLSWWLRKPFVLSVHGTFADMRAYPIGTRWLYRMAFAHAACLLPVSHFTRRILSARFPDIPTKVVPGGFKSLAQRTLRIRVSDERRVLAVGAVKRRKGFHALVEAVGLLRARGFEVRVDCVGPKRPDAYLERLAARIKKLGLEERVRFHGRVPETELHRFYAEADLFVLPSEHDGLAFEGLGLVYLEAMAHGLPVIGCLESGAEDVIEDGVNGRLVPPARPEALAAAIEGVLGNEEVWKSMSDAASKSVDRFRWDAVGGEMQATYETVVRVK